MIRPRLDEAALNTIGYVLHRYGALSGQDLEHLTHTETPWLEADARREPRDSARISNESMADYSRNSDPDDDQDEAPSADSEMRAWLGRAGDGQHQPRQPDSIELRARLLHG